MKSTTQHKHSFLDKYKSTTEKAEIKMENWLQF